MQLVRVLLANLATLACSRFPHGFWRSCEYIRYQSKILFHCSISKKVCYLITSLTQTYKRSNTLTYDNMHCSLKWYKIKFASLNLLLERKVGGINLKITCGCCPHLEWCIPCHSLEFKSYYLDANQYKSKLRNFGLKACWCFEHM